MVASTGQLTLESSTVCGNTPVQIYGEWTDNGGNHVGDACPEDCPGDFNGDGVLSYEELLLTRVQRKLVSKEERLWRAFCEIDVNGDERISAEELLSVVRDEHERAARPLRAVEPRSQLASLGLGLALGLGLGLG